MNKKIQLLLMSLIAILLSGCVAVFVAGAAAGGLIVSDQRDIRTLNDDAVIRQWDPLESTCRHASLSIL